jgi:DNA polymerase-3 subunit gamma/tau
MAYLVLARKSRPQTFDQVVGQLSVVKTLKNSILRERIAHAILFSGVRGVGKTTLARLMAKAINCRAEPALRPCDKCGSCEEIRSGASLDLYEIDGASNRGIQEIRELKEKIRFLPTSSKYKVIIIDEVHMLTTEAFNALLKTLEEPPAHVYFMFATTEIHKIPVTILSRCQQYELKRVSARELFDHFRKLAEDEGFEIAPAALSLIVREAGGSVRDGLSLLDQMFSFGDRTISLEDVVEVLGLVNRELLNRIALGLLEGNRKDVLSGLQEIFGFGTDLKRFLEDLMSIFRGLLLLQLEGCEPLVDLPDDELGELKKISRNYSAETFHLKLTMLMEVADKLKISAQPRLELETSFLKIIEAGNVVAISTLLGHFDEITRGLGPMEPVEQATGAQHRSQGRPEKKTEPPGPAVTTAPPKIEQVAPALEGPPLPGPDDGPEQGVTAQTEDPGEQEQGAGSKIFVIHPHEKKVRGNWPQFIEYVKERKQWMAQDLLRADSVREAVEGEVHLGYNDPANCILLRNRENVQLLTEFALDFFQKPLKIRFIVPEIDASSDENGNETPHKKRQQLANDPLTIMAAEVFNGQIGDIRIGPRSR